MLKKTLIILAVVVAALIIIIAVQPSNYHVERSTTIAAPPAVVFNQVNNFHNWHAWSPWAKLDPTMKETFAGAPAGAGAIYSWSGNNKVGEGRMLIVESHPDQLVNIKLDFIKPLASTSIAEFTFKPQGNVTEVTWNMDGQKNFLTKAFSLLTSMDKLIGPDFEKGLAQLKAVSEGAAK